MKIRSTTNDSNERLNVIVEGTRIMGDIVTESNLRIDGEVLGNVSSKSKVVIGANGKIKGNLICSDADIEGNIEGILTISNVLSLKASAMVVGEITTSRISIEEGAQFSGNCVMQNHSKTYTAAISQEAVQEENVLY